MTLESVVRLGMMEDLLERRVLKGSTVDITCNPVIVEHRCALTVSSLNLRPQRTDDVVVVHVIGGTGDASILSATLPDQFKQIVDTGKDIVHEDDRVEHFVLVVSQLVQGYHGGIPDLCQVLDTMVELTSGSHRSPNDDSQSDCPGERVKDAQESFRLVVGAVLVDRHVNIVITEDSGGPKERGEDIRNDVERVVQVDGEEVLVLLALKVPSDILHLARPSAERELRVRRRAAEQAGKPARAGPRAFMANEGDVPLVHLLGVEVLHVSRALFGVMWRERADQLEDVVSLLQGWEGDL